MTFDIGHSNYSAELSPLTEPRDVEHNYEMSKVLCYLGSLRKKFKDLASVIAVNVYVPSLCWCQAGTQDPRN